MSEARVVAVGTPPTFRHQVARALERDPEGIDWVPTVSAVEESLSEEGAPRASAVVLSPAIKEPDAFGLADYLARSAPATAVLLVRDTPTNGSLTDAMRAGIRDVIDLSRGGEELREALQRALAWSENLRSVRDASHQTPETRGQVISIFSSKGGTGKTFLACNLGAAIAQTTGLDTAVVDLELGVGDIFAYFGQKASRPLQDILAIGSEEDRDAIIGVGTALGRNLWGYGATPDPASAETVAGGAMGNVVRTLRRTFPYTVIDATTTYTDPVLAAFDLSDEILLIAALDVVGLRHLSMAFQTLTTLGFPRDRFRVVLNRADSKVGLTLPDVERAMKVKPDATIPSSRLVPTSLNRGRPIVMDRPKSDVSKAVIALAKKVAASGGPSANGSGPDGVRATRRGLFGRRPETRTEG